MGVKKLAHIIEEHYLCHGVQLKLRLISGVDISGRLVFQIILKPGTRTSAIFERASDIQIALGMQLFQPFRDGLTLCLAVSKNNSINNSLVLMLKSKMFCLSKDCLPVAIGYDMRQRMVFDDLAKMPHIMYAGATNSGKSMGLICLILSLIIKQPVRAVNIVIFDIGANTLEIFNDIPHLSCQIIKNFEEGIYVVERLVEEMDERITFCQGKLRKLPAIVCVIDEYVSFINNITDKNRAKRLANNISNLIRRGRHAKIHMVISTQDPVLKNMKVDIGNVTNRLAFKCAKCQNSIAILGESGAEKLSGKGMLLYKSCEYPDPIQLQGAYISHGEITELVEYVKSVGYDLSNKFVIPKLNESELSMQVCESVENVCNVRDEEFAKIIIWTLGRDRISVNQLKQKFLMGNRANHIMDRLCELKIVDGKFANQPRKVVPVCSGDLSPETVCILERYGYDLEYIEDIFRARNEQKNVKI